LVVGRAGGLRVIQMGLIAVTKLTDSLDVHSEPSVMSGHQDVKSPLTQAGEELPADLQTGLTARRKTTKGDATLPLSSGA
jgi:hypothetical protein